MLKSYRDLPLRADIQNEPSQYIEQIKRGYVFVRLWNQLMLGEFVPHTRSLISGFH